MSTKKTSEAKQQQKGGNEKQYSNQSRTNGIAKEQTKTPFNYERNCDKYINL